jgi:hypothetical protein
VNRHLTAAVAFALFAVVGCKPPPPPVPPLVNSVAVLLFDSEANNINAPDILQKYVQMALQNSPYRPLDLNTITDKLTKAGISDGGQLAVVDPGKLGRDLGVQALIFGNVATFSYTNVGYYTSRKVTLELKMVDVATGATLWEHAGTGATRKLTFDPTEAKRNLAEGLARETVEKIAKAPLDDESRMAVIDALRSLPGYRYNGFAKDPDLTAGQATGRKVLLDTIRR